MSPFDMMLFFFMILIAIKCVIETVEYWKQIDEEAAYQPRHGERRAVDINACIRATMPKAKTTVHPNTKRTTPTTKRAA